MDASTPILLVTGLMQHTEVNVMTGIAMATFGGLMLAFGLRAQRRGGTGGPDTGGPGPTT